MKTQLKWIALAAVICAGAQAQTPVITVVANAEGEQSVIAPSTWVEIKGQNLSKPNDTRTWQSSDFVNNPLPTSLDGVSVTVNGKSAFVYYISPAQVNILTPPDAMQGAVSVVVTRTGIGSGSFIAQARALSPSFFVINGGPYVLAQHGADSSLVGPSPLYPGQTSPAKTGESVVLYANGFGPAAGAVVNGAPTLSPLPSVAIGGLAATVSFAGLISPGLYQINVIIPAELSSGDQPILATYRGSETGPVEVIAIQGTGEAPTQLTLYAAPNGNDSWSGRLPATNSASTDGPVASFDRARALAQGVVKAGLTRLAVQFRGGTYPLASPGDIYIGRFRRIQPADPLPELSRRNACLHRRLTRNQLDEYRRQHLEDHAARVHPGFRDDVLQRRPPSASSPGGISRRLFTCGEHDLPGRAASTRERAQCQLFRLHTRQRLGVLRPLPVRGQRPDRGHVEESRSSRG